VGNAENLNGIREATQFSSTNQPPNAGRKRNVFKDTQKDYELSLDDMRQMMTDLLSLNAEELKAVTQDKTSPVFKIVIATAIIKCIREGNWTQVNYMADRLFGRSKETIEHTGKKGSDLPIKIIIQGHNDGTENNSTEKDTSTIQSDKTV